MSPAPADRLEKALLESFLTARLAAFTDDADVIQATIEDAFNRFDPLALRTRQIN